MKDKLLTAEEWSIKNGLYWDSITVTQYANYKAEFLLKKQLELLSSNIGFKQIDSKQLNSEDYQPFIMDSDSDYWVVDKQLLVNTHEQILKQLKDGK